MSILRKFAAVAFTSALLLTAACDADSKAAAPEEAGGTLTPVTYLTGAGVQGREAFIYVAIEKGYFREEGLDVKVQPGNGTEANLKLLQAGQADYASVDITAALIAYGEKKFVDFTIVNAVQQLNLSCIMALDGSGISSPKDLAGKTIAYIPGGVVFSLFKAYGRLAGVDGSKIKWVVMNAQQMPQNLAAGSIDAATQFAVGKPAVEAAAKGKAAVVLPFSTYLTDLYGNGLGVTKKRMAENPKQVTAFNKAMLRGLEYAMANPDEAGDIYAKYQKLQPAKVAAAENKLMKPYVEGGANGAAVGSLDRDRVARNIAIIQSAGLIPAGLSPEDAITYQIPS
ncbi:ABC transporter substrate-binding protein [Paractinoplanes durhamensis]|uniref:Thiamine pyrimidine synthase n=1 Tax=Paractinoplanes durhamensis TaxID=113563 RepID=A0ABQ3Z6U9_9ACTN|nr:ABC transporter substrate-binding protein [Actinoplanes durhamensis]GIE05570.1 ABC transporter substrate-binding protein [Actinoplanes durhamensis]